MTVQDLKDLKGEYISRFKGCGVILKLIDLIFSVLLAIRIIKDENLPFNKDFLKYSFFYVYFLSFVLYLIDYCSYWILLFYKLKYYAASVGRWIKIVLYYLILFFKGFYFLLRYPLSCVYARRFVLYRDRKRLFEKSYAHLLGDIIFGYIGYYQYGLEDQLEEYEDTIIYGPPKAERELWFLHSYEYLAAKKRLAARFASLLENIIWEKNNFRYNYFFWFPLLNSNLREQNIRKFIIGLKQAWVLRRREEMTYKSILLQHQVSKNILFLDMLVVYCFLVVKDDLLLKKKL